MWLKEPVCRLLLVLKVVGTPQDLHECAPRGFEIPDSLTLFYVTFRIKRAFQQLRSLLLEGFGCCLDVVHKESEMCCAVIDVAGHRALLGISVEGHEFNVDVGSQTQHCEIDAVYFDSSRCFMERAQ